MISNNRNEYFLLFDWLRIILAIIVALGHDDVIQWQHAGNLSVQVFFALSGWLIGGILLGTKEEELPRFFFNRVTRIWIPYLIAIFLMICASFLKDDLTAKWLEIVFYKITFVYNLFGTSQLEEFKHLMPLQGSVSHFWSICAEEQFYLLAPLIIVLMPVRIGKSLLLWLIISMLAISFNAYAAIALGVLASILKASFGNWHMSNKSIVLLCISLFMSITFMYVESTLYIYVAPIFSIVLVLLLARPGPKNKISQFLGGMSYPFYLNHWIGIFCAHAILDPFGMRDGSLSKVIALALNLIIAAVLYYLVDSNIRKYRTSWFTFSRGISSTVAAYGLMIMGLFGGLVIFNVS
ncbi:MAG: acyltransferase [Methylophaga sp.]|nr:acyltransferase [Methylophaga sp.]